MKDDEQCGVIFEVVDNENVFLRYQGDVFQQTIGGRLIKDALPNDFASVQYHTPVNQAYMEHGLSVLLDRILFAAQKRRQMKYVAQIPCQNTIQYFLVSLSPQYYMSRTYVYGDIKALSTESEMKDVWSMVDHVEAEWCDSIDEIVFVLQVTERQDVVCIQCNDKFLRATGQEREAVIAHSIETIFSQPVAELLSASAKRCIQDCKTQMHQMVRKAGARTHWEVMMTPFYGREARCAICYVKDVTEVMQQQERIDELLQEYQCFFQTSTNGIAVLERDESGLFQPKRWNETFETFYRQYKYGGEKLRQWFETWIEHGEKPQTLQCSFQLENDKFAYYNVSFVPLLSGERIKKIFVTTADTTEVLKLKDRLNVKLTKREEEILSLASNGYTNKYIAYLLGVTEGTVKKIISNGYRKLGISSRPELVKFYLSDRGTTVS